MREETGFTTWVKSWRRHKGKHEEGSRELKVKFEELLNGLGVQGLWKVIELSKF